MRLKKQPVKQLNQWSGLYFIFVLILLLTLVYIALEWKTPPDDGGYDLEGPRTETQNNNPRSQL